ncbi:DUF2383 domain-containing protein [Cellvibrio mixtus]|uniref:DUF2383 domain-containing protein n=1 Tax=Cellvibrio mixtus TaxID=39650 RepID=UPI0005866A8E|nr:DUF2383 domain-containing protein [Cellvibrio mixtus]
MFRLLSDLEVSLNELLVTSRESVDHYRDAVQLLTDEKIANEFKKIADERKQFIPALENKIRELGDLPSMPDPDKEDGEMLIHHISAAVSEDYTSKLLQQRIDVETRIVELIDQANSSDENNVCGKLLADLALQVNGTIETLSRLAQQPA